MKIVAKEIPVLGICCRLV